MIKKLPVIFSMFFLVAVVLIAQDHFSTSLHGTRMGKETAYNKENGGMELLTDIPIDNLPCKGCHAANYPDGEEVDPAEYSPGCRDCHNTADQFSISQETCLTCHSRKVSETAMYPDVENPHTERGMKCWNCHSRAELHGDDGIEYASMLAEGAIKAKCTNCHKNIPDNSAHNRHGKSDKFECQACHIESIVQCQNCHLESVIDGHIKRAQTKSKDFQLLVKRNGKYTSGSFMTHVYDGKTNIIYAPMSGHLIVEEGKGCSDCHHNMGGQNEAIAEYNETGFISLLTWNEETKKLDNKNGIIPLPEDWAVSMKVEYANYMGDRTQPSDPEEWVFLKAESDNAHLFYCEPLSADEMQKIGFTRDPVNVDNIETESFVLMQNYPNPANSQTRITFRLNKGMQINVSVYDVNGRLMETAVDNYMNANEYSIAVNTSLYPSGTYYYRISGYDIFAVKEMQVIH